MALNLEDIAHLLATRGVNQYGREAVSQLEHALQCAQWAEKSGETPATVVAALLHDLGHLLAGGAAWAKPTKLQLVCIGAETIETIRGEVVEPVQQGQFRVEYRIDLARGLIESARSGQATAININAEELNFGSATNFHPEFKDSLSSNGVGTGTSATGIRIDRKTGRYFSMAT
eukprot:gene2654-3761_t